jgi:hypothetical protein
MKTAAVLAACLALAGCATYHATLAPPKMTISRASDRELDCGLLEAAIARTDTVRWVIRDDGGRLETAGHRAARYTANVVLVPTVHDWWADDGHAALDAADRRLVELLRLKRAKGCAATATAVPDRNDLQFLPELEQLLRSGSRASLDRRSELFDALRIVPAPATLPASVPRASVPPAVELPISATPPE